MQYPPAPLPFRVALVLLTMRLTVCPVLAQDAPTQLTDGVGINLALIEANHYERGAATNRLFAKDHHQFDNSEDGGPVHPVILTKPFYIAKHEVTVAQFKAFVDATSHQTTVEQDGVEMVGWDPSPDPDHADFKMSFRSGDRFNWRQPGFPQEPNHPVVGVSHEDAKAFCRWLSERENAVYRLPTEAEWECVCRAGTQSTFSFGDDYPKLIHQHANIGNVELEREAPGRVLQQWLFDIATAPSDGHVFTAPVGSYKPNPWGVSDMHGNVWEWCEDRYLDTAYRDFSRDGYQKIRRRAIDPLNQNRWNNDGDWRVIRGGSWFNAPVLCRSGVRGQFEAKDAACYIGFRVVREAPLPMQQAAMAKFESSEAAFEAIGAWPKTQIAERRDGRIYINIREELTDEMIDVLQRLQYAIDLQLSQVRELSPAHISSLAKIPRLTGFSFSGGGVGLNAESFSPLKRCRELEVLQITGLVNLAGDVLDHFASCDRLSSINLQGTGIDDRSLLKLPKLQELQVLHVGSTSVTGECLAHFRDSPLQQASFGVMDDDGAEHLREFAPTLRNLDASGCPITRRGLESIASLRRLESLRLRNCKALKADDLTELKNLYSLRDVQLDGTTANDESAASLSHLNWLSRLSIGGDALTDTGLKHLCGAVSLDSLTVVDASRVSDAGLSDLWRLVNLQELSLSAPHVSGSGLATLSELKKLRRVTLECDDLSDVAIRHAAASESLQQLNVSDTSRQNAPPNVSDKGILELSKAKSLKQFRWQKKNGAVTDQALAQLEKESSNLQVTGR